VTVSRLSFASVYSTICTKSIVIAYKFCYKRPLYFGLPRRVMIATIGNEAEYVPSHKRKNNEPGVASLLHDEVE
jgi:hypothetical protein